MSTNQSTTTLAYYTLQITKPLAIQSVSLAHGKSTIPVYLEFMPAVASVFRTIVTMHELALIMSSKVREQASVRAHVQLSCVYLASILNITYVIK